VLASGLVPPVAAGFALELADGVVLEGLGLVADALGDVLARFATWLLFGRVTTSRTMARRATTSRASSTIRRGRRLRPSGGLPSGMSYRTTTSAGRVG
jgi:hypothetical protein